MKNIDAVVVPVGGGGLIAGVALAVKSLYPHIQGKHGHLKKKKKKIIFLL